MYCGCLLQNIMLGALTPCFVRLAQGILCRGVGACFFTVVLLRFRKAVTQTQV